MAKKRKLPKKHRTVEVHEDKPASHLRGAIDTHDHKGGWIACAACQAEHVAERVGGRPWALFICDIISALGAKPFSSDTVNLRCVKAMGVDLEDAKAYWLRNFSGAAYVKLRPKLKLPPSERKAPTWDGMAPCGKHGADYEGQVCSICPQPVTRLFDATTEVCTPFGQQVSMHVRFAVDDMIKWLLEQDPDASMRDFEQLVISSVQMVTARHILLRRRRPQ
jgi:hypothetical protein